jgi:hypothetical protein
MREGMEGGPTTKSLSVLHLRLLFLEKELYKDSRSLLPWQKKRWINVGLDCEGGGTASVLVLHDGS